MLESVTSPTDVEQNHPFLEDMERQATLLSNEAIRWIGDERHER